MTHAITVGEGKKYTRFIFWSYLALATLMKDEEWQGR
jgi:hypothetical protein